MFYRSIRNSCITKIPGEKRNEKRGELGTLLLDSEIPFWICGCAVLSAYIWKKQYKNVIYIT